MSLYRAIGLLAFLIAASGSNAADLTPEEKQIIAEVESNFESSIQFLEKVVNINSGTLNPQGVREVGRVFDTAFSSIGFETKWVNLPKEVKRAGHLFAERKGTQGKRLLLIGHLDTVFEKDSPFQRFVRMDTVASGPGTSDMKGGDVVILYALKALHSIGALENTRIIVALTGDEENPGRPLEETRKHLIEAGKRSDIALGFESMVKGTATIARRGFSGWTLRVTGTQGHSSAVFGDEYGYGAIYELARILTDFRQELGDEEYLTFNPGVIAGGTDVGEDSLNLRKLVVSGKSNIIAQTAISRGDLRFISDEQKEKARQRMRALVERHLPETGAEIEFQDGYPAMAPTDGNTSLLKAYNRVSQDLGYGPIQPFDPGGRGAADISFVARYVDGLDGLGVLGKGEHSPKERIYLSSLEKASKMAAILIYRLTR